MATGWVMMNWNITCPHFCSMNVSHLQQSKLILKYLQQNGSLLGEFKNCYEYIISYVGYKTKRIINQYLNKNQRPFSDLI